MNIRDVLKELGSQMGLDNLKLDENRVCRLVFDKEYAVDIEASEDEKIVHIYARGVSVPPEKREEFYALLLEANLFGKGTGGAMFALDQTQNDVYLCRALAMDSTDYQDFVNVLESFVNHLEAWAKKIDSGALTREGGASKTSSEVEMLPPGPGEGFIKA